MDRATEEDIPEEVRTHVSDWHHAVMRLMDEKKKEWRRRLDYCQQAAVAGEPATELMAALVERCEALEQVQEDLVKIPGWLGTENGPGGHLCELLRLRDKELARLRRENHELRNSHG